MDCLCWVMLGAVGLSGDEGGGQDQAELRSRGAGSRGHVPHGRNRCRPITPCRMLWHVTSNEENLRTMKLTIAIANNSNECAKRQAPPSDPDTARSIVEELFPYRADLIGDVRCLTLQPPSQAHIEEVSLEEVERAARSISPNKAPGPDSIPNIALLLALSTRPDIFAKLLNRCLREGVFPVRPICLIDTTGKLLEKVVCARLERSIAEAGDLSPHQYGFRKARSIAGTRWKGGEKEYCLVVTLDIKNAFNTARWSCILRELESFDTPSLPHGVHMVGFADDVTVLVVAKDLSVEETTCNQTIARIQQWLDLVGLELAPHKTEAVLVSSRKKVETANISVAGTLVSSKRASKFLGVLVDTRLCFREHLAYMGTKAATTNGALSRLMLNTRGPKLWRRQLLTSVTRSRATHGVWQPRTAFRTVSDEAAHVIAGIAPLEFLVEERSTYYQETHGRVMDVAAKRQVRMACKQRWDTTTKERWTHQLIPSIDAGGDCISEDNNNNNSRSGGNNGCCNSRSAKTTTNNSSSYNTNGIPIDSDDNNTSYSISYSINYSISINYSVSTSYSYDYNINYNISCSTDCNNYSSRHSNSADDSSCSSSNINNSTIRCPISG
ncbi:GL24498 [Drosophila persimilis]|uniref:GL24498 n=1 Tax=Drosophila persimilis TaxID=7234 RepID=B4G455_DROPE|nr:GL24498 [Drosophila persimilis]